MDEKEVYKGLHRAREALDACKENQIKADYALRLFCSQKRSEVLTVPSLTSNNRTYTTGRIPGKPYWHECLKKMKLVNKLPLFSCVHQINKRQMILAMTTATRLKY